MSITSNSLIVDYEGVELSGKSSAAQRVSEILTRAIPRLSTGDRTVDYLHTREPGGCPRADIVRALIKERWTLAHLAGITPDERKTANLFTLARDFLYTDVILPRLNQPGDHIITSDRTWVSMLALQGDFNDGRKGVPLDELDELAMSATKSTYPNIVILRKFDPATIEEVVNFRQLNALVEGRDIMPKDIAPVSEFIRDQNRFDTLAQRYKGKIDFVTVDAALDPLESTRRDLEIIASTMTRKMPHHGEATLKSLFDETYTTLDREGTFNKVHSMLGEQDILRTVLSDQGLSPVDVMNDFRKGETSIMEGIKKQYEGRLRSMGENSGHFPGRLK